MKKGDPPTLAVLGAEWVSRLIVVADGDLDGSDAVVPAASARGVVRRSDIGLYRAGRGCV